MEVGGNGNVDRLPKEKDEPEPRKDSSASKISTLSAVPHAIRADGEACAPADAPVSMFTETVPTTEESATQTDNSTHDTVMTEATEEVKVVENVATPDSELTSSFESVVNDALRTIRSAKQETAKSCVNTVQKLLLAVQKHPDQLKNRKLRLDNLAIKKFVVEVKGGLDLMKAVGFNEIKSEKDVGYLLMEEAAYDAKKVDFVVTALSSTPSPAKEETKKAVVKAQCVGGCGFWGDEAQDGYCSLCFKKKLTGQPMAPAPAAAGGAAIRCKCGFYGQKQYDNMCSVCYHKAGGVKKPVVAVNQWRKKFRRALIKLKAVRAFASAPRLLQKNKTRCWTCSRKVGITGIDCKCGFIFCGTHRYPDEHNCRYDHKGNHQKVLRKHNQQIVSKKFDTID